MALISKKTFRKWAQPLTDRKLTLENAERFAEVGNTVHVRARRTQSGIFTVDQAAGKVTWEAGCAWLDGGVVNTYGTYIDDTGDEPVETVGIITPGQKIVVTFDRLDHREQVIYCLLHYIHHGVANQSTIFEDLPAPEEVIDFYTATRAECVDDQVTFESDFSTGGTLDIDLPVYINTFTNVGTTGIKGVPVCRLTWVEADPPDVPYGYWSASTYGASDPSKIIIFNLNDYSDGRSWPTTSEMLLV
tara:strand:- start:927 stop:1664 length:738 start_codon:yes stop_codon:yes gene_type:complete